MKTKILITFILLSFIGCKNSDKAEIENQSTINVESDDKEMSAAIEKANQTLTDFNAVLSNPKIEVKSLKVKFETSNGGGEHIWLADVEYKNGKYSGILDNEPEYITEYKIGDKIEVDNSKISDWMYIENGKLIGGYTIKLLRARMTEAERKQFDAESGMQID